jgi:hypothetical protein
MPDPLTPQELTALVERVFRPGPDERTLALLVDLPASIPDRPAWKARRQLVAAWAEQLRRTDLKVSLYLYPDVRANNADLPPAAWPHGAGPLPEKLAGPGVPFEEIFRAHRLFMAVTELSATAPLKVAARRFGFRAATMPGFSPEMVPALRLDLDEVARRVERLKQLLDEAEQAELHFAVRGGGEHRLVLDLRHRTAHASTGLLREPGTAGNLPSGEAYVVPYEGEQPGDPSRSAGELPVQLRDEVVVYVIEENRARRTLGDGEVARAEARRLVDEPAYGNLAELGLGVLAELGVEPCGELLLDEKLGLHIAFGRSEHFGGQVGPAQFSRPEAVVHQDRVYLPSLQPRVQVRRVDLTLPGKTLALIRDDRYVVDFG